MEQAARGTDDARANPWGDDFDPSCCNCRESGMGGTTPVGIYPGGPSPYGCLDMAANVWDWTRSLWGKVWDEPEYSYPYDPLDVAREDLAAGDEVRRIVRGGAFYGDRDSARCAYRLRDRPDNRFYVQGFRVVLRSSPVS